MRFLKHGNHFEGIIGHEHPCFPQGLHGWFVVARDTTRTLVKRILDELLERKIDHIVTGKHQQIIFERHLFYDIQDVTHGSFTVFVADRSIVDDGDGFLIMRSKLPRLKIGVKRIIGHNKMFVNGLNGVNISQQTVYNGLAPNVQQGLGKVFR
ncbi:MAG: hypothetical protein BWY72_01173 [Bacteroidetes bacterium ADurb.Bin416]|nr:MAG: hypothetical protein BWY72_01173 [Bacteroidetes bacterium ADurb.Bin416]